MRAETVRMESSVSGLDVESESTCSDRGGMRRSVPLLNLSPREQLRAGRLPRRVTQLLVGLTLYGVAMAMMLRATLGLDPWDVLHAGVTDRVPLSFGQVTIVVGALVLLLWIPLRQ